MSGLLNSARKLFSGATAPAATSGSAGQGPAAAGRPSPAELTAILAEVPKLKQAGRFDEAITLLASTFARVEHPVVGYRLVASLLQQGQYRRILDFPGARPFNSRDYALAEHLLQAADPATPLWLPADAPALDDAALLMMIKDEEDIVLFNLVWHYHLGLRRFFILDNLSTDGTAALIAQFSQRFADATVFTLRDPVQAHLQSRKTTGAARFVMSLWPDLRWWFPVDADEFLCPTEPMRQLLDGLGEDVDALVMPKSVYKLRGDPAQEGDAAFFERMTRREPLSPVSSKILARVRPEVVIAAGNHRLADLQGNLHYRYASPPGLTMREYPIRSLQQYVRKTINGGQAVESAKRLGKEPVGGEHWVRRYQTYLQRGEAGLLEALRREVQQAEGQRAVEDPLPLLQVMEQCLPDWRAIQAAAVAKR
jgi:hypothetical protein